MSDNQNPPASNEENDVSGAETVVLPRDPAPEVTPEPPVPPEVTPDAESEAPKADDEAQPTRHSKRTAG